MNGNTEKLNKADKVALDILRLSSNTLLVDLRFLDMALSRLEWLRCEHITLSTDGEYLLYDPIHILRCFKSEKERPIRDYLHIILHCVYRHMFMNPSLEHVYWDLACDIAVENVISELGLRAAACAREKEQQQILNELRTELKNITAEKLYHYLREAKPDKFGIAELRGLFYADDHEIWYMTDAEIEAKMGVSLRNGGNSGDNGDAADGGNGDAEADGGSSARMEISCAWKDIAERMQQDLETFSKRQGDRAGSMMQNLAAVNRERYDYTAFLKKFAVMGEAMKLNDDEFDYIYYTYGLRLYRRMPLVEPLEYKNVKRIREFVIAIDTSGSTSGELVQKFVQKTYNILKSTENFFTRINLHIIQCDADIQEHVKITKQEEFDEYLKNMEIHGLGGTDFRPVFGMVDELVKAHEFSNLKGLIYFTDGYGTFPERKPDYQTAFVFVDDEYNNLDVPPWAIRLVLQKDEI